MSYQYDNKYPSDFEVKRDIVEIGRRMYARNFVAANDGNISAKVSDNTIWCTPTGVSKGYMTEDMLVLMDLDGNVLKGNLKPSTEIKMHLRVYRENPEVNAVVHAHPPAATSYAIAGLPLNHAIMTEAVMGIGEIPLAPYAMPGTEEVPNSIAPFVKTHNACLLAKPRSPHLGAGCHGGVVPDGVGGAFCPGEHVHQRPHRPCERAHLRSGGQADREEDEQRHLHGRTPALPQLRRGRGACLRGWEVQQRLPVFWRSFCLRHIHLRHIQLRHVFLLLQRGGQAGRADGSADCPADTCQERLRQMSRAVCGNRKAGDVKLKIDKSEIRRTVLTELARQGLSRFVPVGISARHVHLTEADIEALFGKGYKLNPIRPLSQPGQFAAREQVTVIGPRGRLEHVRVLGPARKESQVEISISDSFVLGAKNCRCGCQATWREPWA